MSVAERGYAHDTKTHMVTSTAGVVTWARPSGEDNWELRWPNSIRMYSKMLREDSQAKSVLRAVTQPILRTTWRLDANGADPAVVQAIAEDLDLEVIGEPGNTPVARNPRRVSWSAHLERALKWALTYGHAYFELVWDDASQTDDGLTHLRKIAPRHPDTITGINIARDGGLVSIEQAGIDGKDIVLPVKDLLVYRHDDDGDDWVGQSMFRAAYKHWRLKDQFLKLEAMVLDRNGMGVPVMKVNEFAGPDALQRGEEIVQGLRAGDAAGAVIGSGDDLKIQGVSGQLVSPREAIAYHDSQIARTALAHALNLDGKGGSYALAEVQMDLFFQSLNMIADQVANTANQYLIRDMVRMLTGDEKGPFPKLMFDAIEAKKSYTPQDLAAMKQAGLIFAGPDTEAHLRRVGGLPHESHRDDNSPRKDDPHEDEN